MLSVLVIHESINLWKYLANTFYWVGSIWYISTQNLDYKVWELDFPTLRIHLCWLIVPPSGSGVYKENLIQLVMNIILRYYLLFFKTFSLYFILLLSYLEGCFVFKKNLGYTLVKRVKMEQLLATHTSQYER